jgi:hypothetical protein
VAERMTVVIVPEGGQENLTVEDAMRQVLNVFELLSYNTGSSEQEVIWRLVEAKTNSPPFSVVAEARSVEPGRNIDSIAKAQKLEFLESISQIKTGQMPQHWQDRQAQSLANELFERLKHGVTTKIIADDNSAPILLKETDANIAETTLAKYLDTQQDENQTKPQMGSLDGILCQVTTYYSKPAIVIRERKSQKEITCTISEELRDEFDAKFDDVWSHRRVVVRGLITYGKFGEIKSVSASLVTLREERNISVSEIRNTNFTNGLTAVDYLNRLREGHFG